MIIIKYLVRETLKSQMAILFILLLIFFSQKLIWVLDAIVEGDIPTRLVLSLLVLGVPEMAQLILPLSLFLSLLMTFSKLYAGNEITVMHACGFSKRVLIVSAMLLALGTSMLTAINVMWFGPWSAKHQGKVVSEAKANPGLAVLAEGQFRSYQQGNAVLFIGNVKGKQFSQVFLAQLHPDDNQRPSVVVADSGQMLDLPDGSQVLMINKGRRYEGTALLRDFRITDFNDYQTVIGRQPVAVEGNAIEQASMTTLWHATEPEARAEFHWRLTLIFLVMVMALLVVPLSVVNPRQGRTLSMLPAMLIYLIFFLLQNALRAHAAKGQLDPLIWMWAVNSAYLGVAVVLNLWDSLPTRKLRVRLRGAA